MAVVINTGSSRANMAVVVNTGSSRANMAVVLVQAELTWQW